MRCLFYLIVIFIILNKTSQNLFILVYLILRIYNNFSRELKEIIFEYIRNSDNKMFADISDKEKETLNNIILKLLKNIQNRE